MTSNAQSTPAAAYIDALLQCSSQLMLILDHMARNENPDADASIDETLARLLEDVLDHETDLPAPELETAADVLVETSQAIADGLFLVDPTADDQPPPPPGVSSRNGRDSRLHGRGPH